MRRVSFARVTRRDVVFILCHRGHGSNKVEEWTVLGGGFLRLFNAVFFVWGECGQCGVVLGGGFLRLFNAVVFVAENGVYFV